MLEVKDHEVSVVSAYPESSSLSLSAASDGVVGPMASSLVSVGSGRDCDASSILSVSADTSSVNLNDKTGKQLRQTLSGQGAESMERMERHFKIKVNGPPTSRTAKPRENKLADPKHLSHRPSKKPMGASELQLTEMASGASDLFAEQAVALALPFCGKPASTSVFTAGLVQDRQRLHADRQMPGGSSGRAHHGATTLVEKKLRRIDDRHTPHSAAAKSGSCRKQPKKERGEKLLLPWSPVLKNWVSPSSCRP